MQRVPRSSSPPVSGRGLRGTIPDSTWCWERGTGYPSGGLVRIIQTMLHSPTTSSRPFPCILSQLSPTKAHPPLRMLLLLSYFYPTYAYFLKPNQAACLCYSFSPRAFLNYFRGDLGRFPCLEKGETWSRISHDASEKLTRAATCTISPEYNAVNDLSGIKYVPRG